MPRLPPPAARPERRGLVAVLASTAGVGLTIGITYPLLSVVLEGRGVDPATIGLNAAMPAVATLALAPLLPRIIGRLGMLGALYLGLALSVSAVALLGLTESLAAWFALRLFVGAGIVMHWVTSEAWINAAVDDDRRGRVIGLYATLFSAGFAGGPLVLGLVGTAGFLPFAVTAAVIGAAGLPLLFAHGAAPAMPARPEGGLRRMLFAAPTVMAAALLAGYCDIGIMAMLPLYGLRNGLPQEAAVVMLTAFVLGSIALQLPLGWLGDRLDRRRLLLACAAMCVLPAVFLPAALGEPWLLWPLLFVWGGAQFGIYTVGLALLGRRFGPAELAGANAAYVAFYETGGLFGPATIGAAMAQSAPYGLPAAIGGGAALFVALGLARARRAAARRRAGG